jgi:hypothetical protein
MALRGLVGDEIFTVRFTDEWHTHWAIVVGHDGATGRQISLAAVLGPCRSRGARRLASGRVASSRREGALRPAQEDETTVG